jgi:hypothetical protein
MENSRNRNYDQNAHNVPYTNLERSVLHKDLNQEPQNEEGFEEFTNDQPNRFNGNDRNVNKPNPENYHWKTIKNRTENDLNLLDLDENYRDVYRRNPLRRDSDL